MTSVSNKQIWLIAYPILISVVMEHMINLTDTIFLGHYGETELAASALAGVYYLAMFVIAFGFCMGAQIIIARRNGEKHFLRIGSVLVQGIFFMIALAAAMFAFSKIWTPGILSGIIQSPAIYQAAMDYLDWRIYGFFFIFAALMFRAFFVGITQTKTLTINSLVMVGTNIALNYALIFGHFGFPRMGIAGAAIASSVAELVSLLFFVVYTYLRVDLKKYGFRYAFDWRPKLMLGMLSISSWTMVQSFLAVSTWFIFFLAIEHLGERSLALANVARSVASLLFMIVSAFSTTTSTLVSNQIGSGRSDLVMETCNKSVKLCTMILLPLIVVILIFPAEVISIFTNEQALVTEGTLLMQVMTGAALLAVPAFMFFNAISGTGNTQRGFWIEILCIAIYTLAVYLIVYVMRAPVAVCWSTEYLYGILMFSFSYAYMKSGKWKNKKV